MKYNMVDILLVTVQNGGRKKKSLLQEIQSSAIKKDK